MGISTTQAGTKTLSGAATGAAMGSVAGPYGTLIGAGVGAAAGLASSIDGKKAKQRKALLNGDMSSLENGTLGMTAAERRQATRDAMGAAGQQVGQAQGSIARDSLNAAGSRDLGAYTAASQQVGATAANAGAAAAADVDKISEKRAADRRAEILGRLDTAVNDEQYAAALSKEDLAKSQAQAAFAMEKMAADHPEMFGKLTGQDSELASADARPDLTELGWKPLE